MNILKFNPKSKLETQRAVDESVIVLKKGGIIIHPTDTCYGIAADMGNEKAIKKVYRFKGRDFNKPCFIIARNVNQFKKYGSWNKLAQEMIEKNPRKMFTFVVSRKKMVPEFLNPDFDTVGIQMPKRPFSQVLLKDFGRPLVGTSANLSSLPVVYSIEELMDQLSDVKIYPDLILDGGRFPIKKPSSIIRIKGRKVEILRK